MKRSVALLALLAPLAVFASVVVSASVARAAEAGPDVIYYNGKIVTLDAAESTAGAVAVKDGKFLKVGSAEEVKALAGPATKLVDLGGRTVVPGLIDAHCHPMETIMMKDGWVDCRYPGCPSVKQALANIAAWAAKTPKGKWIFAAAVSASENKFAEKRLPTKAELDAAAPDNPTILADGTHLAVANSMALKELGVTKGVSALKGGGSAILDKDGEPTGTLTDAMGAVPDTPSLADLEDYYTRGIQDFWNAYGFTSLLAITPSAALPVLQGVAAKMKPSIRYTVSVWTEPDAGGMPEDLRAFTMPAGADPAWYRFAAIKDWVDGENDCRTGYMYERYKGHFDTDPKGDKGTLVTPLPVVENFAGIAEKNGVICMLHCSGDRAMDIGLTAYENQVKRGEPDTIKRIEHFGMFQMTDEQLKRAVALVPHGFNVSIQPTWLLDLVKADYENMGGKLASTGFEFRKMIDAGLEPPAGTDMTGIYMANINPLTAIYACVTRNSDMGVFQPEEAVSVTEALKMWTVWAARSMGEFDVKGSIEPGKYADMAVLSDDIFTMPKEGLKDVRVLRTIVGGDVVYEAKETK